MPSLFAYGTLCNQNVQILMFGRTLKSRSYVLEGYTLCRCDDGFYTVKEKAGSRVAGKILDVTDEDLLIADEWELVPLYERKQMHGDAGEYWVYIRSNISDVVDEIAGGFSAYPEEELLDIVRDFMAQRQAP